MLGLLALGLEKLQLDADLLVQVVDLWQHGLYLLRRGLYLGGLLAPHLQKLLRQLVGPGGLLEGSFEILCEERDVGVVDYLVNLCGVQELVLALVNGALGLGYLLDYAVVFLVLGLGKLPDARQVLVCLGHDPQGGH